MIRLDAKNIPARLALLTLIPTTPQGYKKSVKLYQELIRINPLEVRYYHDLAHLYEQFGDIDEAIEIHKKVITRFNDNNTSQEALLRLNSASE